MSNRKTSKLAIQLPFYIAVTLCVGVLIGANMVGTSPASSSDFLGGIAKFRQVLTHIENDYVDEVETDKLVDSAIRNMLKELDPHSYYIPSREVALIESRLEGKYEGVGIEFDIFKDTITVISAISGGPSELLGIQSGDKIVTIEEDTVASIGITNQEVVERLRGPGGSEVTVGILRKGEPDLLSFTIQRDVIPQYSVDASYMVNEEVGYIKISRFGNTTFLEFKQALFDLKDQGMKKMILDLTGNPGGYMNRAVEIVDEFIAGEKMIVYSDGKEPMYTEKHYSGEAGDFEEGSLVIMMDEGSASASEIVAGAIQDHDRGIIVGRRSYGKGLVQLPLDLNDGSQLRLTISRYYTPSGRSIQKKYTAGKLDDYFSEVYDRYSNGEIYALDSSKLDDSLVFKTDKGRIVYGGGGITPDFFVPLDSTENSSYLNRLLNSRSLQQYTMSYAQNNIDELQAMGFKDFHKKFTVTEKMLEDLVATGQANKVAFQEEGFTRSKRIIQNWTKAYIARAIWDNEGFFPIFNEQDEIFLKALQVMSEADKIIEKQ